MVSEGFVWQLVLLLVAVVIIVIILKFLFSAFAIAPFYNEMEYIQSVANSLEISPTIVN